MAKAPAKNQDPPVVKKPVETQSFVSDLKYFGKNGKLYEPGEVIVLPAGDKPNQYMRRVDRAPRAEAPDQAATSEDRHNEAAGQQPGDLAEPKQSNPT